MGGGGRRVDGSTPSSGGAGITEDPFRVSARGPAARLYARDVRA